MSGLCKTCGERSFSDQHRCPPSFEVIHTDELTSDEAWKWAVTVHAHDPESAAEKYADRYDCEGDYSIVRGTDATVVVKDTSGNVTRWIVSGEAVPSYSAREVQP